jgi:hypothetical protein
MIGGRRDSRPGSESVRDGVLEAGLERLQEGPGAPSPNLR